jgi:hypothetical protein
MHSSYFVTQDTVHRLLRFPFGLESWLLICFLKWLLSSIISSRVTIDSRYRIHNPQYFLVMTASPFTFVTSILVGRGEVVASPMVFRPPEI